MAIGVQVAIDCADPDGLARFWCAALGYRLQDPPPGYGTWQDFLREKNVPEEQWNDRSAAIDPGGTGPRLYFQRVPEPKEVKNRLHLDLNIGRAGVEEHVQRLVDLGARVVEPARTREMGEFWAVLADPEGNEFCVH